MLAQIADLAIILSPHLPIQLRQLLPQVHDLCFDNQLGALGRGSQIRAVQRPAHVAGIPLPGSGGGQHGDGGADVEDEGHGAAVEVPARVAEGAGDRQGEGREAWLGGEGLDVVLDDGVEVHGLPAGHKGPHGV